NIDTANRVNPISGKIVMSNLCSEILQVQRASVINNRQEYEVLGTDISCNLGSTNIVNLMASPNFGDRKSTRLNSSHVSTSYAVSSIFVLSLHDALPIFNIDTANRVNPISGKIVMSNLCSEILQVQRASVINNRQEYEVLGTDISCNLGSTNIVNLMASPNF